MRVFSRVEVRTDIDVLARFKVPPHPSGPLSFNPDPLVWLTTPQEELDVAFLGYEEREFYAAIVSDARVRIHRDAYLDTLLGARGLPKGHVLSILQTGSHLSRDYPTPLSVVPLRELRDAIVQQNPKLLSTWAVLELQQSLSASAESTATILKKIHNEGFPVELLEEQWSELNKNSTPMWGILRFLVDSGTLEEVTKSYPHITMDLARTMPVSLPTEIDPTYLACLISHGSRDSNAFLLMSMAETLDMFGLLEYSYERTMSPGLLEVQTDWSLHTASLTSLQQEVLMPLLFPEQVGTSLEDVAAHLFEKAAASRSNLLPADIRESLA